MLAIEVNRSKFIIRSSSRQIEIHLLLSLVKQCFFVYLTISPSLLILLICYVKKTIIRILDPYLRFKKPNLKMSMTYRRKYTWIIVK